MGTRPREITFIVAGEAHAAGEAPPAAARRGHVGGSGDLGVRKALVRVALQRGSSARVRVNARPGEDVVVLTLANGPRLVLHPEHARDLLLAQAQPAPARSNAVHAAAKSTAAGLPSEVNVPAQLGWPGLEAAGSRGATRGWMGRAVLTTLEIFTGPLQEAAASLAAAAITRRVDGMVDQGVYRLSADSLLPLKGSGSKPARLAKAPDDRPLLVLIHGAFLDTSRTFGKLWSTYPQTVRDLFAYYDDRVYAFDHPTMGQSPIHNALALANAMPDGARLHLLTHSRGGLVGEVLARACSGRALTDEERAFFGDAKYEMHRADLQSLVETARRKKLTVERMVRVACPARGTLLASKRFDAYLSVLQWALDLAGVPVAPELVDFLNTVAQRRGDPTELPGIEAMMPESAFMSWLEAQGEPIVSELRVVAGDLEGDSVASWVKTLLSDGFYWTDNDLVVQTRSMYGGTPRTLGADSAPSKRPAASFVLDRGGKVSHFSYFSNARTAAAIASALTDTDPKDFQAIGPLSWAGSDASGTRAVKVTASSGSGSSRPTPSSAAAGRPAVFVLPGILGSNLTLDGKRIWLGFRFVNALASLAWEPRTTARIEPDGPIGHVYDDLIERLARTHEVVPFAFDWRRPMEDEAQRLADAVDAALDARHTSAQPVRILAHSMGGLLARTLQLERPKTWRRMMDRDGARLLMLGTPNAGSWSPMQTLSGDDTFGNTLVAFGSLFDNSGARRMMAGLPGFMQLQAGLLDPALGLHKAGTWKRLADDDLEALRARSIWHSQKLQLCLYEWAAPPQKVLDGAVALRRRLEAQLDTLGEDAHKIAVVVGVASFTPAGFVVGPGGLEYVDSSEGGDGRVTLSSAQLPGVRTWKVGVEHGKLPACADAFRGYIDLLETGETRALDALPHTAGRTVLPNGEALPDIEPPPASSPTATLASTRSRPSHGLGISVPPSSASDVLSVSRSDVRLASRTDAALAALSVRVLNGDLKFVAQPLLVGHYRALKLTGTEAVVDGLVAKSMSAALSAGLYPDTVGSHHIFGNVRSNPDNPLEMARPAAAVVVGLGEEGKLSASDLVYSVRQAVLAYAQRLTEKTSNASATFDMASTLIGSGGTGITVDTAAQLITQGAIEANRKLQERGWPLLRELTLVEIFLERAGDAWRALRLQELAAPNRLRVVGKVQSGAGALRRPLESGYRGAAYDFITALIIPGDDANPCIDYTIDTRRARTEVRARHAQGSLLRELVAKASNNVVTDARIGRTLFNLLVPVEMEPFLAGSGEMVIELEQATAAIPWELLDTNADGHSTDRRPWAVRSKLIRKLRTADFRSTVLDASADDSVLVVGEPLCSDDYPPLDGARKEAMAVAERLKGPNTGISADRVYALVEHNDAQSIINTLFERPYRLIHVAGHGEPGPRGGVVLSGKNTYLGANEVKSMRNVPELVFLNCCHLAGHDAATTLKSYDRAAFAANIAEELISVGVRCVIAAGWAVDDDAAETFAIGFYAALLEGARFIDAVGAAREATWSLDPQGNTWAAYQCYGDPEWTWRRAGADPQRPPVPPGDELAGVASPVSLALVLDTLATRSQYGGADPLHQLDRLRYLEGEFALLWGSMGSVAEAFGSAYASAGAGDKAIEWFTRALAAPDSRATFAAAEQLANLLVRRAEKGSNEASARDDITAGIEQLERLLAVQPTMERRSLLGAAYKRLTMVEWRAGHKPAARNALEAMVEHYTAAETMARELGADNVHYPAKNAISAEVRAALLRNHLPTLSEERLADVSESLRKAAAAHPEFWSVAGQTELLMIAALAEGRLARAQPGISASLRDLKERVPAPAKWDSVYSEALFTLEPYLDMAQPSEQRAARKILVMLAAMAERAAE